MHRPHHHYRPHPHRPIPRLIGDPHNLERPSLVRVTIRAHGHQLRVKGSESVREGGNVGERLVGCVVGGVEGVEIVIEGDGGC
jgi:hypothetical protein